ncbi:hypothetical protein OIU77_018645 [Salix suchowensis]|uniref:Uncharacterized protein n=1 Tax=Salix suchowensis TaxID=1278906 RepID=A0ABQ9CHD6_9ROSI|nr:hypothetical protein OIU77_018645 [Salix suchowensis]
MRVKGRLPTKNYISQVSCQNCRADSIFCSENLYLPVAERKRYSRIEKMQTNYTCT